ncbi:MAG: hypothetical protein U0520_01325 [Candidatus Saccharimonadales bacterium]
MKNLVGIIAVALTFIGYIPYIRDTIKGKTKPHIFTWFIWGFVTAVAFGLQLSDKAGPGAFVTLAAAIVCLAIALIGLRKGSKEITKSDTMFLVLSMVALVLWLFAEQAVLSVILLSLIDILGFIPTIRKSWHKPGEETLISYVVNTVRFCLALYALERYTIVTILYPLTWVLANGLFSVYLIIRRGKVANVGYRG